MKISKIVGKVSYLMFNCDLTFCKREGFNVTPVFINGSCYYNFNFSEVISEILTENISLELPFKSEYVHKIDYRRQYKNNYFNNKEQLFFNSSPKAIIKILNELYPIEITDIQIEYENKNIHNKNIKIPKKIKAYCREDIRIVRRKINLKKLDI